MIRILTIAALFAGSTLAAEAATTYGRISGFVLGTVDITDVDGIGLFGAVGANLTGQAFQIDFSFPSSGIASLPSGGFSTTTTAAALKINNQTYAFDMGLLGLEPDSIDPGHYLLTDASTGSFGSYIATTLLALHAYTDLPVPFALTTPIDQLAFGDSVDLFDVVLTDAQSSFHGETLLGLDTRRIQIFAVAVPLPAGGGLMLAGLGGLLLLRRSVKSRGI